jgi:hypothetical protein
MRVVPRRASINAGGNDRVRMIGRDMAASSDFVVRGRQVEHR